MNANIGKTDRAIRIVIGLALVIWGVIAHAWIPAVIGIVVLFTAFTKFCLLYKLIGINTCPADIKPKSEDSQG